MKPVRCVSKIGHCLEYGPGLEQCIHIRILSHVIFLFAQMIFLNYNDRMAASINSCYFAGHILPQKPWMFFVSLKIIKTIYSRVIA